MPKNIFHEVDKRTGKKCIVYSKNMPNGKRIRTRVPDMRHARQLSTRVDNAIYTGTWEALLRELKDGPTKAKQTYTVREFIEQKYRPYAEAQFTTDFTCRMLNDIVAIVGSVPMDDFDVAAAEFFKTKRLSTVAKGTVNHGINVLSGMFEYAKKLEIVDKNPIKMVERYAFKRPLRQVLKPHEARQLVEATLHEDPIVGAYVGILAETGLRRNEGLHLKRTLIDLQQKQFNIEPSKNMKPRKFPIPLTEYAIRLLRNLPAIVGNDYVFVRLSTGERLKWPNDAFNAAKKATGITWPTFHDLRRYRATQWLRNGCSIDHVRDWLGHHSVKVTELYLVHVEGPAIDEFRLAEQAELRQIQDGGDDDPKGVVA